MKLKNKIIGIIVVLGTIIFIGGLIQPLGIFNHKNINKEEASMTSNMSSEDCLVLVNKQNPVDVNYKPSNLVKPNIRFLNDTSEESRYLEKEAADALENLFQAASSDNITLIGSSAYRSYESQVRVLNEETKKNGTEYANNYVAKPGQSEHQTGLAIDVTNEARCFDKTSVEAQWLDNNAYRFGFILRYPEGKEDMTGYNYEPWHIRYVGKDVAKEIYERGITLEEYLNHMV